MAFFKKLGTALKKVIKPGGLLSKVVSKIPVIGGIASGAIDIVGGLVQKIGGKSTAGKQSAGSSFVEAYQDTVGGTFSSAAGASLQLEGAAMSPITKKVLLYGGLGVAALIAFMMFKKRR